MPTFTIIEHLNVLENIFFSILVSFIYFALDLLILRTAKETFRTRIIPAITLSVHAANNLVIIQQIVGILCLRMTWCRMPGLGFYFKLVRSFLMAFVIGAMVFSEKSKSRPAAAKSSGSGREPPNANAFR